MVGGGWRLVCAVRVGTGVFALSSVRIRSRLRWSRTFFPRVLPRSVFPSRNREQLTNTRVYVCIHMWRVSVSVSVSFCGASFLFFSFLSTQVMLFRLRAHQSYAVVFSFLSTMYSLYEYAALGIPYRRAASEVGQRKASLGWASARIDLTASKYVFSKW